MTPKLLTPAELSEMLGKPERSLGQWRYLGLGPKFVKVGNSVRYRESDVLAWLDANTAQRTNTPASA